MIEGIGEFLRLMSEDAEVVRKSRDLLGGTLCLSEEGYDCAYKLIMAIPQLAEGYVDLIFSPSEDRFKRMLAMEVVNYLIMPFDLIPEEEYGFYGYVDDALVFVGSLEYMDEEDIQHQLSMEMEKLKPAYHKVIDEFPTKLREHIFSQINRAVRISDEYERSSNLTRIFHRY